jgi:hypothetical protein
MLVGILLVTSPDVHRIFGRAKLPAGLGIRWDTALRKYFDAGDKPIRDEQRLLRTDGSPRRGESTGAHRLQIAYYKATVDDKTCLEILKSVVPFATSAEMLGWQMNKASLLAEILDAFRFTHVPGSQPSVARRYSSAVLPVVCGRADHHRRDTVAPSDH